VLALSALGVGAFNTCLYIAAQTTSALNIVLLQSAMPVLVVAATFLLFRETVSARQASGVAVSLAGALTLVARGDPSVLAQPGVQHGRPVDAGGDRQLRRLHGPAAAPPGRARAELRRRDLRGRRGDAAAPLRGGNPGRPSAAADPTSVLAIGYVAAFASVLAYLSFNRLVALVGPNTAGLAVHLVPVFGTVLAVLLLGEVPRRHHAVGMALIAAGIWFAARKGGPRPA
jgi:drug/metabolite transporter (DMT)-like permease